MEIKIKKLTTINEVRNACSSTIGNLSNISLNKIYKCMHSPIRTQIFWIDMIDIPTFVSVHLVRHKIGVEHFVYSNRVDRGGKDKQIDRNTPINHSMMINAESLINFSRKRLCYQASKETREVMLAIKEQIKNIDIDLYEYMVPECHFRNGYCPELRPCGHYKVSIKLNYPEMIDETL